MNERDFLRLARQPKDVTRLEDGTFRWRKDDQYFHTARINELEQQMGTDSFAFLTTYEETEEVTILDIFCRRKGRLWCAELYYSIINQHVTVFRTIIENGQHTSGWVYRKDMDDAIETALTYLRDCSKYRLHFLTETVTIQYV